FGDGSTTLFTLGSNQINRTDQPGNGEFVLGFRFIQTQASAYVDPRDGVPYDGVKLAKPDAGYTNPMEYFSYSLTTLQQNAFAFFASPDPNTGAGVYVRVWGETFTPEPATIGLAGWAGVFYLARRPSRRRVEKLSRIAT
ncbi:MAG TPA: hypothetical protein VL282_18965, partial [Tepidisphaeraceae bacterium]|nr:hypothetical protein [Tepidisphaeraceae bacterium]